MLRSFIRPRLPRNRAAENGAWGLQFVGMEPWELWRTWSSWAFLKGYLEAAATLHSYRKTTTSQNLLDAFVMDKLLRLGYESTIARLAIDSITQYWSVVASE